MADPVLEDRRTEARHALEGVLSAYADVFGPEDDSVTADERPVLDAWVLVTHWADLGGPAGWTTVEHSGCPYPMQLGLMTEVLQGWEHMRSED